MNNTEAGHEQLNPIIESHWYTTSHMTHYTHSYYIITTHLDSVHLQGLQVCCLDQPSSQVGPQDTEINPFHGNWQHKDDGVRLVTREAHSSVVHIIRRLTGREVKVVSHIIQIRGVCQAGSDIDEVGDHSPQDDTPGNDLRTCRAICLDAVSRPGEEDLINGIGDVDKWIDNLDISYGDPRFYLHSTHSGHALVREVEIIPQ